MARTTQNTAKIPIRYFHACLLCTLLNLSITHTLIHSITVTSYTVHHPGREQSSSAEVQGFPENILSAGVQRTASSAGVRGVPEYLFIFFLTPKAASQHT